MRGASNVVAPEESLSDGTPKHSVGESCQAARFLKVCLRLVFVFVQLTQSASHRPSASNGISPEQRRKKWATT